MWLQNVIGTLINKHLNAIIINSLVYLAVSVVVNIHITFTEQADESAV